jgi:hypothetical protein
VKSSTKSRKEPCRFSFRLRTFSALRTVEGAYCGIFSGQVAIDPARR